MTWKKKKKHELNKIENVANDPKILIKNVLSAVQAVLQKTNGLEN